MKWSNKEASNKETRRRSMRASWEPPVAHRSGEDRVERNARLGYRLGKEVLAAVENRELSSRARSRSRTTDERCGRGPVNSARNGFRGTRLRSEEGCVGKSGR